MVSAGMTCVKYLLFVFNLLFAISGIIILSIGAIIQATFTKYTPFIADQFFTAPVILIVVGVIIFIVAFFGCCGAVKENHCMIITFSVFLLLIFILEVAGGIAGYMLRDDVKGILDQRLNATLVEYGTKPEITKTWDLMQHELECCGINNYTDWKALYGHKNTTLPVSCCKEIEAGKSCVAKDAYQEGCLPKFTVELEHNTIILGGAGIGIAFVQLLGVAFACCLARSIRREYETV